MESFTTTVALIGIVIVVASLLSGALERSGLPLVAVFLALGAALGPYGLGLVDIGFSSPALHALAVLGLALVLFSDAVTLDLKVMRENRPLIWRLLGPGTLIPAGIVALAARFFLEASWPAAAILGAALASTDPVLLRSALRSSAMPKAAGTALRTETGMNDVIVLPIVVLSMLFLGFSANEEVAATPDLGRSLVGLFILGPGLGAFVGWIGIVLLDQIRSRFGVRRDYESLYALGLALSAFAAAESVGGSGFLAAFAAGILVSSQDVELCDCFLEYGEATSEMLLLLTFVALGTSLIWTGFLIADVHTVAFTIVALAARTLVLYPVLRRTQINKRERRIIALFGPRGLSSLILTLLPVFAGIPGSERLFTVTCLVVLCSIVLHGGGMMYFLRSNDHGHDLVAQSALRIDQRTLARDGDAEPADAPARRPALPAVPDTGEVTDARITIDELRRLQQSGEEIVVVDARAERNLIRDDMKAAGSVRLQPDHPVQDATAQRLSKRATLVVYCA